ncbi:helix-turn-helix transcriptional regulator [uncultured Parvimonas sp.]|uniref:helix-turn-helix domain-containing protein n=1 Tax=uncultured Parvimonas sp. TaxID=747372 RepID=UPI0028D7F65E|nr:helix-turn-helix transcriptional regulator [uncultured Parvimonas sp.]
MIDLEKLRNLIDDSGLKINYIANELNISREGLYHKLEGKTEFKVSEVQKLAKVLNMSNDMRNIIFFKNQ